MNVDVRSGHEVVALAARAADALARDDPALCELLTREHRRQEDALCLVASASVAHPSVFAAQGLDADNHTTEGMPRARFHPGSAVADEIEELAIARACEAFGASAAFVQPYSGTSANYLTLFSLCEPGDALLSLDLASGGHLSHGAAPAVSRRYLDVHHYGLDSRGWIDLDQVRDRARRHRPRVIIAGASSYPRAVDLAGFREIADEVGAWLMADVSHVAGLVLADLHPDPLQFAHVTTTSTYKQLGGPRGGLVLLGRDAETTVPGTRRTLRQHIARAVFPYFQGTPSIAAIAAKARALQLAGTDRFARLMGQVCVTATALADELQSLGYDLVTGGTDTHLVLVDLAPRGVTGAEAQDVLEGLGILANKNLVPADVRPASVTSGLRMGTNTLAFRGMGAVQAVEAARVVDRGLRLLHPGPGTSDGRQQLRADVEQLVASFPLDGPGSWAAQ